MNTATLQAQVKLWNLLGEWNRFCNFWDLAMDADSRDEFLFQAKQKSIEVRRQYENMALKNQGPKLRKDNEPRLF